MMLPGYTAITGKTCRPKLLVERWIEMKVADGVVIETLLSLDGFRNQIMFIFIKQPEAFVPAAFDCPGMCA